MNQLKSNSNFAGIWTWSRGGGWRGPYIKNELWCDVNVAILANWANHMSLPEKDLFKEYAIVNGFKGKDVERFHRLSLLSADAIVRGRASLVLPINVWWTRDQFIGGEKELKQNLKTIIEQDLTHKVLLEKSQSVTIWKEIVSLANKIQTGNLELRRYLQTSAEYGFLLYSIYEQGWIIMLKGYEGDMSGQYDTKSICKAIDNYDRLWKEYKLFAEMHPDCATLYEPYSFDFNNPPLYHDLKQGLNPTVDKYRTIDKP